MDNITLYRVAHPHTKTGPWNCRISDTYHGISDDAKKSVERARISVWDMSVGHGRSRPTIYNDIGMNFRSYHVCAVTSLEDLKFWFNDPTAIDAMFDAGFTIYKISVPREHVLFSRSGLQVVYDRDFGEEVEDLSLLPLVA